MNLSPSDQSEFYQAVSPHAVFGLLCGVAGVLALWGPLGWPIPALGVILSAIALARIRRDAPALTGRKAAMAGLFLSVLFAIAGPTEWIAYQAMIRAEALKFAHYWFEFLRNNEPQKAYQLSVSPGLRQPLDASLWEFYRRGPRWYQELDHFVSQPTVRTLLALGRRAEVRFYEVDQQDRLAKPGENDRSSFVLPWNGCDFPGPAPATAAPDMPIGKFSKLKGGSGRRASRKQAAREDLGDRFGQSAGERRQHRSARGRRTAQAAGRPHRH